LEHRADADREEEHLQSLLLEMLLRPIAHRSRALHRVRMGLLIGKEASKCQRLAYRNIEESPRRASRRSSVPTFRSFPEYSREPSPM
jgi:hypothetical protein